MIEAHKNTPLLGVVAASGTGKTTLLSAVIPLLSSRGLRIGCIKHTHHPFEVDRPGKDSYQLRVAGAKQMLLGSAGRWALMVETDDNVDAPLLELVEKLELDKLDLVLVEGFRLEEIPKIELHRTELAGELTAPGAPQVVALVSNQRPPPTLQVPVLDIDDPPAVADFIFEHLTRLGYLQGPLGIA